MAATDTALLSLNAGKISRLALARIDLAKLRIAAEKQQIFCRASSGRASCNSGAKITPGRPNRHAGRGGQPSRERADRLRRRRPKTVVDLSQN